VEIRAPGKKDTTLAPVRVNADRERTYSTALQNMVRAMTASYEYWLAGKYDAAVEANADADRIPDLAQDAKKGAGKTTRDLFGELTRLRKYWADYFDKFATKLAEQATDAWYKDNANSWTGKLKRAGFDIKMQLTPSQTLILKTKVRENVALIKSIHEDYHKNVEGVVSRAFIAGRDLSTMTDKIKDAGGVSTRRAAFIARDQANKATAQMNDARQRELNLKFAYWIHSSAGREPRLKHVTAGREQWIYIVGEGIDFKDGFGHVLPGSAINCRCTSRTIIPALGRGDVQSLDDLEPVPGYPGAYRAKKGKSAGAKTGIDVVDTRVRKGEPVKYS
jgi:uncharacterized protein with gpF-like domain